MATTSIQRFADSAGLKVAQYVATALLLPLLWRVVDRLDRIEASQNVAQTAQATMELRVRAIEALVPERGSALKAVQDKVLLLEFRTQDLEGRVSDSRVVGKAKP